MSFAARVFSLLVLATGAASVSGFAVEPLVCRLDALSEAERDRHRVLTEKLRTTVVSTSELADGYELTLDLARLPKDGRGQPFCVVEVAEWVDLEARCCPFLDFGIDVRGKGGATRLRLTGAEGVKAYLKSEMPLGRSAAP
jgi:hypothetical protein